VRICADLCVVDSKTEVTFQNVTGEGRKQWVAFHYSVNDRSGNGLSNSTHSFPFRLRQC
jgi:hypothetical protein